MTKRSIGLTCVLLLFALAGVSVLGQQEPQATDDVLRINTELVQTIVTVADKEGRFVDGLKKENFELRVDGRSVPITFFENIVSGSHRERIVSGSTAKGTTEAVSFRQRTIVFFVDDRHLSLGSLDRTRKTLSSFIDKEMGQNDLVAIASASGQIGFLQQFTGNKDVLRAAVARLNHVPYVVSDYGGNSGARMTENMALSIERRDDSNVFEFYIQDCMRLAPRGVSRQDRASVRRHCEIEVQNRARQILLQASVVTADTYYSLETLLGSAEQMPGSKLAFFISDGFLADTGPRGRIGSDQLERLADKARRAGVVIYTIDARGLVSGALDATGNVPFDPNGRLDSANAREIAASQDALNALAVDTGGRALRNQNYFDKFVNDAVAETSRYYLLAWRPEPGDDKTKSLKKIEISVAGRSDLTVRSARRYVDTVVRNERVPEKQEAGSQRETKEEAALRKALGDFHPKQAVPLHLSLMYLDTPASGIVLTSSVQAATGVLSFGDQEKDPAELTLAGVVLNDKGKRAASFNTKLTVNPPSANDASSTVIYNFRSPLKPGIYQVRVAARDTRTGLLGSAMEWIAIPETRQLALSSLILGVENVVNTKGAADSVQWSVDKKFSKGSLLKFMVFVYNSPQPISNNLTTRVEVLRNGQVVMSIPAKPLVVDKQADPQRLPFTAEIDLAGFQPGAYLLVVTVDDRTTQKTASQQTGFYVQ